MKETTFQFGKNLGLVGTLTSPDGATAPRAGYAVVLFNAGLVPRIGPNRVNVRIARTLVDTGFHTFRFDLSGRGDSAPADGMASFEEQAIVDLTAAMDTLAQRVGAQRFLIMGICSGAENAYHAALVDPRIVAISLMDPYHFPTWRTHFNRYRHRAAEHGGWLKGAASWLARRVLRDKGDRVQDWAEPDFGSIRPPPAQYAANLKKLIDRGVAIDILYSGGFIESYNYSDQFRDVIGRYGIVDQLRCEYRPEIDHTISVSGMQQALIERTSKWFDDVYLKLASR